LPVGEVVVTAPGDEEEAELVGLRVYRTASASSKDSIRVFWILRVRRGVYKGIPPGYFGCFLTFFGLLKSFIPILENNMELKKN